MAIIPDDLGAAIAIINRTLVGAGALQGKPCRVQSITPVDGGNNITMAWTEDDGTSKTQMFLVKDGVDGFTPTIVENPNNTDDIYQLDVTDVNGTFTTPNIKGERGAQGVQGIRGEKGEKGEPGLTGPMGISPTVTESTDNTQDDYKLNITDVNGSYTTPNLIGRQGVQGIQGEQGPQGEQGVQGIQGPQGERGADGYPFLIYREYASIDEFDPAHFPEIGLMFMVNNGVPNEDRPVYRYTGSGNPPYSHVTDMSTAEGLKGDKGEKGDQGEQGVQGEKGADGVTFTPVIGTVTTVDSMNDATADVVVDTDARTATFNFSIPRGPQGIQGPAGEQGLQGDAGADGTTYTPAIGTVELVENELGVSATVEVDEESKEAKFNFKIPQGKPGTIFTPVITENGELAWENDGELPNPPTTPIQTMISTAPLGTVLSFAGSTAPNGYLLCDGASYKVADYEDLYAVIGNTYGGDSTNFNVPNLVDKFIQGSSTSGTEKEAGLPNITGSFTPWAYKSSLTPTGAFGQTGTTSHSYNISDNNSGASVTFDASKSNPIYGNSDTVQPPALTMVYIIKAKHTNEGTDTGVSDDVVNYVNNKFATKADLGSNVPMTEIAFTNSTNWSNSSGNLKTFYMVKNGWCFLHIVAHCNKVASDENSVVYNNLPIPPYQVYGKFVGDDNTYEPCNLTVTTNGQMLLRGGTVGKDYSFTYTYPVA